MEFVEAKQKEERKAWALIEQGYDGSFNGPAYGAVAFQNVNQSVRVTDHFMEAAEQGEAFGLRSVRNGEVLEEVDAAHLLHKIAEGTHVCGDPGMQYEDTIQRWHTCKTTAPIHSSNPCCFTGDTLVDTTAGQVSFEDLHAMNDLPDAFGFDLAMRLTVARPIRRVWVAGETHRLAVIRTEQGLTLRSTIDHRYLTHRGQYVEARNLKPGMPLRTVVRSSNAPDAVRQVNYGRMAARAAVRAGGTLEDIIETALGAASDHVASVEMITLDAPVKVYDMEVEDIHNFNVTSPGTLHAVVVHNSEYMFLDDSACNLASLNLRKFQDSDGKFDVERFRATARIFITAMEILVDNAGYPSADITQNSHAYRPLGLGFANLGALLMAMGLPYDSDEGRAVAGAVTAIEHAEAYARSAEIAANPRIGPFEGFAQNREPMLDVMQMHHDAVEDIHPSCPDYLRTAAQESMDWMLALGQRHGYRNAQATVLAPTGCLTADAMVLSSEGLLSITELGDPKGAVWQDTSFSIAQEEGTESATKFYVNGRDHIYRIRTTRGHQIKGTWKHCLRVIDERGDYVWRRMKDIREGDVVVLRLGGHEEVLADKPYVQLAEEPMQDPRDGRFVLPRHLDEVTAEVLGYYVGDGYVKARGGLHLVITDSDPDLLGHFGTWVEGVGAHPTTEAHPGCTVLNIHGRRLYRWMHRNGFAKPVGNSGEGAAGAFIPVPVLRSRTSVLAAFLRGLFEADGTVSLNTGGTPVIELTTVSEVLARQVQVALESLGIAAVIRAQAPRDDQKGRRMKYRVRLSSVVDCEWFEEKIGFVSERKRSTLSEGLQASTGCTTTGRTLRHKALLDDLYEVSEGLPTIVRQDVAVRRYQGRANLAWAARLIEHNPQLEASKLARYLHMGNLQMVEVEAAEYAGEEETFDISVPIRNTYIANGFVSHNTIAFMMDCDTTGIEPDIALVKYKLLAGKGDGMFKIVNQTVPEALHRLGYDDDEIEAILAYIDEHDTIEGAPNLKDEHLAIFDCAFKPFKGTRSIHHAGHIKMMAATQPFISGAISKTCNVPEEATIEEIKEAYAQGWKLGLKALAIYRENSKRSQPLSTSKDGNTKNKETVIDASGDGMVRGEPEIVERVIEKVVYKPVRKRLPDERPSLTHKFSIGGHEGYLHVGLYQDTGMPGEIFITMAKQGSTISGLMDAFATSISIALQYGVPLEDLCAKFSHMRFDPSGYTNNRKIPRAKSIMDYIFRYLALKFLGQTHENGEPPTPEQALAEAVEQSGPAADETQMTLPFDDHVGQALEAFRNTADKAPLTEAPISIEGDAMATFQNQEDSPPCSNCGAITVRSGACYLCVNCGASSGCG